MPRHSHDFVRTDLGPFSVDPAKPLGQQLYSALRRKILNMELKPGAPISEIDLALACGSSRTPARQAIQQLVSEQLLESFPSRGTFVAPINLERLRDALFIRQTLEPEIARREARAANHRDLARTLEGLIDRHDRALLAGDHTEAYRIDSTFHQALCGHGQDRLLWRVLRLARAQGDRLHALSRVRGESMRVALTHHRRIALAMARGDGDGCFAAMQDHMTDNQKALDHIVGEFPEYFLERHGPADSGTRNV